MAQIYDLCSYRTEKLLKGELTESVSVLGTDSVNTIHKIIIDKLFSGTPILVITQKDESIFTQELLNYINTTSILEDSIKTYKLLYKSPLFVLQATNSTELWLKLKKMLSHRKIEYIMFDDYALYKKQEKDIESIRAELGLKVISFVNG